MSGPITTTSPAAPVKDDNLFYGVLRRRAPHPLTPAPLASYQLDGQPCRTVAARSFAEGRSLLLWGETGTGKTEFVKWLCGEIRVPLFQVQGHLDLTWADLTGDWKPNDGAGAAFTFIDGPLVAAMTCGGCFLLDEASSVKQGVLNGLNEVLNGVGKPLAIETDRGHRVVTPANGFRIALTLNPWGQYAGNQELNSAFTNRFRVFEWPFLDADAELAMLQQAFPQYEAGGLRTLVDFANDVRAQKVKTPDATRYVMSHRDCLTFCEYVTMGYRELEAANLVVLGTARLVAPDEVPALTEHINNVFDG